MKGTFISFGLVFIIMTALSATGAIPNLGECVMIGAGCGMLGGALSE